jgi:hypothetical protein
MDLMWFLFLAHLTGDYALQTDRMAADKGSDPVTLTAHVTVYTLCIALTLWLYAALTRQFGFFTLTSGGLMAPLFVLHWIQDFTKSRYFKHSKQAYYADQVLHLAQLYIIRLLVI